MTKKEVLKIRLEVIEPNYLMFQILEQDETVIPRTPNNREYQINDNTVFIDLKPSIVLNPWKNKIDIFLRGIKNYYDFQPCILTLNDKNHCTFIKHKILITLIEFVERMKENQNKVNNIPKYNNPNIYELKHITFRLEEIPGNQILFQILEQDYCPDKTEELVSTNNIHIWIPSVYGLPSVCLDDKDVVKKVILRNNSNRDNFNVTVTKINNTYNVKPAVDNIISAIKEWDEHIDKSKIIQLYKKNDFYNLTDNWFTF